MKQEMAIMHDERGVDNYRSVCTYENVSASVRVEKRRCHIMSAFSAAVACSNYTARKPQRRYLENRTHLHTLAKLSFKFYV